MKLPRRRYWVPLVLLAVFVACVQLDLHYHVLGLCRGDAYYRGMPTSFWRDVAAHEIPGHEPVRWLEFVIRRPLPQRKATTLYQGGPAAQSVLLQLALDPVTKRYVRLSAFASCTGPELGETACV